MDDDATGGACRECVRRSWLLSRLSGRLDYRSREEGPLLALLALEDEVLIKTAVSRSRRELRRDWERFELGKPAARAWEAAAGVETLCRHNGGYPPGLRDRRVAPRMLYVVGGAERLAELAAKPAVAIVGSSRPTDYGMEMARSLARGLAASGVTVVSAMANGIFAAAHAGALEVDGPTVTVMAGGVDVIRPASRRGCYERVVEHGCAVAEPPCGFPPRRWHEPARARTVAGLAQLTVVVEADETPLDLRAARIARTMGQTVAAVPGRVTSPVSRGTNALLMSGAPLVRGPADALDLLYGIVDSRRAVAAGQNAPRTGAAGRSRISAASALPAGGSTAAQLEPRLQTLLEQVGAGRDTPGKLACTGESPGDTLLALTELELMGLLGRGDGGRYVPRESLAGR
jgi:DNA processing protein